MMSRSSILFSVSASRHKRSARTVRGFSQMPPIIMSRPASMRLAMAISPSRDNSSTEPISRRYMRTGSSVRPISSSSTLPRRSEEHTSELQSRSDLVCRLLLEKKKNKNNTHTHIKKKKKKKKNQNTKRNK